MKSPCPGLCLIAAAALARAPAVAAAPDFLLKAGLSEGAISVPKSEDVPINRNFVYKGIATLGSLAVDVGQSAQTYAQIGLTTDFTSHQIVQQGIDVGLAYYVLGGRRLAEEGGGGTYVKGRNIRSASLLVQAGQHSYTTADASNKVTSAADSASGGAFDLSFGAQMRWDTSPDNAFGVEIVTTLLSFSMSAARLTAITRQGLLFWQVTL